MYIDARLQVSRAQALTANAFSTDVIDVGDNRIVGPGEQLWWVILAKTALGTGPLEVHAMASAAANMASPDILAKSASYTAAQVPVGSVITIGIPPILPVASKRYLALWYAMTGTLTVDAFLTDQDPSAWIAQKVANY